MPQAIPQAFDAQIELDKPVPDEMLHAFVATPGNDVRLTVHDDLSAVEREWRAFEQIADCTVFQSFDWLSTWHCHIGSRNGVAPAVVIGRDCGGEILFLLPLAVACFWRCLRCVTVVRLLAAAAAAIWPGRSAPGGTVRIWPGATQ